MNDSSFGSAAPKNRSINVGANLLGEWSAEQVRLRREVGLCAATFGGCLLALAVALPLLLGATAEGAAGNAALRRRIGELDASLATAERDRKAAQPALVVRSLCDRTTASYDRLLSEATRILGAGNTRTAIASARFEVSGGELHALVQADAEEDGAVDAFARNAGEEGAKIDAITSARPSALLAAQGTSFIYEKRVEVTSR